MSNKNMKYSEALIEIEGIISRLENGETDIDEIAKDIKKAGDLIKFCKQKLYATEQKLIDILDDDK